MGNIIKIMSDEVPYTFRGFNIFLTADVAISSMKGCITIQANFLGPFFKMTHSIRILLKIVQKNRVCTFGIN